MGQLVRNITYNASTKVLSFDGLHGGKYNVHFDDVDDTLLQGDRKGTKPASAGTVTIDPKTGTGTFDSTAKGFTAGTKHTVRFVDAATGHVTLQTTFTA